MSKPYETYADKVLSNLRFWQRVYPGPDDDIILSTPWGNFSKTELHKLIVDAWMDGLKYSLVMIESEKRRRDDSQD